MATATLISFACRALQLPYVRTYQSRQPMQARRAGELPTYTYQRSDTLHRPVGRAPWVLPRESPPPHLLPGHAPCIVWCILVKRGVGFFGVRTAGRAPRRTLQQSTYVGLRTYALYNRVRTYVGPLRLGQTARDRRR